MSRSPAPCSVLALFALAPLASASDVADGICDPGEAAMDHCLVTPGGFVVEIIPGVNNEFPQIVGGNSKFEYLITGPAANAGPQPGDDDDLCQGIHDISHTDLLIPVCAGSSLTVVASDPPGDLQTNGQGDPSCGFGTGDLTHDVFKWDFPVACDGTRIVSVTFQGILNAGPVSFLSKAANDCDVGTILGPTCEAFDLFCFGDGSGTLCPCQNLSNPNDQEGCLNSTGQGGKLTGSGFPIVSNDTMALHASQLPDTSLALYVQTIDVSNLGAGRSFGDGLRCVRGDVRRIGVKTSVGGASQYPENGDPSISSVGVVPQGGGLRFYQVFYRDNAQFCMDANFNLTNGVSAAWTP